MRVTQAWQSDNTITNTVQCRLASLSVHALRPLQLCHAAAAVADSLPTHVLKCLFWGVVSCVGWGVVSCVDRGVVLGGYIRR